MSEEFLKRNNIDFNKLNIDPLVATKIRQYIEMASVCHEMAIKNLKNNDIFIPDFYNRILDYCENEKINMPREDARKSFSSFLLAFAIELNLKSIYILSEYGALLEKYQNEKQQKPFHEYCISETRFEQSGLNEIKQSLGATTKSFGKYPIPNTTKELPGKNNGHYLYGLLHNISSQSIRDLIKYETIVSPLKNYFLDESLPNMNQYIQAPEVISLLREFNYEETVQTINNDMLDSSDSFENDRYQDKISNNDNTKFLISFHLATHIALYDLLRKKTYQEEDFDKYIQSLDVNNYSKHLHEYMFSYNKSEDSECFKIIKEIKQKIPLNYYILISKFNLEEIKGIIKNYNETNSQIGVNFEDFLNYYIFFKQYIETVVFSYDKSKIPNVSKLFKTIRETNNISELGNRFISWFRSIDIKKLTQEEFDLLEAIDFKYIYNSLDYRNKIIYNKCKEKNIKFDFIYSCFDNFEDFLLLFHTIYQGNKIPFEVISYAQSYPQEKDNYYEIAKIAKETNTEFRIVGYYFGKLGKIKCNRLVEIAKETALNLEEAYYYESLGKDKYYELAKASIETDTNLIVVADYYEKLGKEKYYELAKIAKEMDTNLINLAHYYEKLGEKKCYEFVRMAREKSLDIKYLLYYYEKLGEEKCYELVQATKETNLDLINVANYYERLGKEKYYKLAKIAKEKDLDLEEAYYYEKLGEEKYYELVKKSKETKIDLIDLAYYYEKLGEEKCYELAKVSMETETDLINVANYYERLGKEKYYELAKITKEINLDLREVYHYENIGEEKTILLLKFLKQVNFNFKMRTLKFSDLLKNVNLVDSVSECILYKMPKEVEYIKRICVEHEVPFNSKLLYFEMDDLGQNIVPLSILLENLNVDITIEDTERLLGTAKQIGKYIPPKTEYEEKEEIKNK